MNEQIDLAGASKLGLESVPLGRDPFQLDELSGLYRIAELHASVARHPGVDNEVADLEFHVAGADLDLQGAVEGANSAVSIRRNLENHPSVDDGIVGTLEDETAVHFVDHLHFPGPRIAVHLTGRRKPNLDGGELRRP